MCSYKKSSKKNNKKNTQLHILNTHIQNTIQKLYFEKNSKKRCFEDFIHTIQNNNSFECYEYDTYYLIHCNGIIECHEKNYYNLHIVDTIDDTHCFKLSNYFNIQSNTKRKNNYDYDAYINILHLRKNIVYQLPLFHILLKVHTIKIQLQKKPNISLYIELHTIDENISIQTYISCDLEEVCTLENDIHNMNRDTYIEKITNTLENVFMKEKMNILYTLCMNIKK